MDNEDNQISDWSSNMSKMNNEPDSPVLERPQDTDDILDSSIMDLIMSQLYDHAPTKFDRIQFEEQELNVNTFMRDGKLVMEIVMPTKNKGDNKTANNCGKKDTAVSSSPLCQQSFDDILDPSVKELIMSQLYGQTPTKFDGIQLGEKELTVNTSMRDENLVMEIVLPTKNKGDNKITEICGQKDSAVGRRKGKYMMRIALNDNELQEQNNPDKNFPEGVQQHKEPLVSTHNLEGLILAIKTESSERRENDATDLHINDLESKSCERNNKRETSRISENDDNSFTVHELENVNPQHRDETGPESKNPKINRKHLKFRHYKSRKAEGCTEEIVKRSYHCKMAFCKCEFSDKTEYDVHMYAHTGLKPVICKICNNEFINVKSFERHQCQIRKTMDENINTFVCDDCGQMFYQKSKFVIHKWSHGKNKPYMCKKCNKKFILISTLKHHMASCSHGKIIRCFKCKEIYDTLSQLKQHVCRSNQKINKCPHCHKKFMNEIYLEKHINSQCVEFKETNSLEQSEDLSGKILNTEQEKSSNVEHTYSELHEKSLDIGHTYSELHEKSSNVEHTYSELHEKSLDIGHTYSELHEKSLDIGQTIGTTKFLDTTSLADIEQTCSNLEDPYVENFLSPESSMENRDEQGSSEESESSLSQSVINTDAPQITMLKCVLCKMSFDTVPSFIQHVNTHKDQPEDTNSGHSAESVQTELQVSKSKTIFICRCCEKKFATHKFATDHLIFCYQTWSFNHDKYHKSFIDSMEDGIDVEQLVSKFIYTVSTGSLSNFTKELASNYTKKPVIYHCSKCNTNFHNQVSLITHIKNCNKNAAKFWCLKCNINFDTSKLLLNHFLRGHQKIFMEPVLSAAPPSDKDMDDKNSVFTCQRCNEDFKSVKEYTEHRLSKHSAPCPNVEEETEFVCAHCNLVYNSQALLYKHLLIHKRPQEKGKTTEYKNSIYEDPISGLWVCAICQKRFSLKSNIVRHISLHDQNEKKDHACPFCSRVFQYQRYLQYHIMYMHHSKKLKNHICDICKAPFTTQQSLKRHMTMHTGEAESQKKFPCEFCEKRFKCKQEVTLHHRSHTGEKPFPCDKCNYCASSYWNLIRHLKTCKNYKSLEKNTRKYTEADLADNSLKKTRKNTEADLADNSLKKTRKNTEADLADNSLKNTRKHTEADLADNSLKNTRKNTDKDNGYNTRKRRRKNNDEDTVYSNPKRRRKNTVEDNCNNNQKGARKSNDKDTCNNSQRKSFDKDTSKSSQRKSPDDDTGNSSQRKSPDDDTGNSSRRKSPDDDNGNSSRRKSNGHDTGNNSQKRTRKSKDEK